MFKNYLLLAFRNMRKNKLHTVINMAGMMVAFACGIFIALMVYRHYTFDSFQQNRQKLYKLYAHVIGPNGEELSTQMGYPVTPALKAENIGISHATSITTDGKLVRYKDKTLDMGTTLVDEDFLRMFSFPVVRGNALRPLASLGSCVLTENSAKKLFGTEDPIGKSIDVKMNGNWSSLIVTAVVKDFPENSTIKFSLLARTELFPAYASMRDQWNSQNHPVYVQLADNTTPKQVEARLRSVLKKYHPDEVDLEKKNGYLPDQNGDYNSLHLLPFSDEHFTPQLSNGAVNKVFLYVLMLISAVILLIASFNFVNLNIGLSFTRSKEIGIRKCLGAGKRQIWLQVWGESFLMVFTSMLVALVIVAGLMKYVNQGFNMDLSPASLGQPAIILVLALLTILVSFIASGYPSSVMASLKTVEVLKGKISIKKPGMLRNALIVTQFVITIVLICSTIVIYQQFNHLRSASLGYNTRAVVSIPIKNDERGREIISQLRTRLSSQPAILSVTGSDANLGIGQDHSSSTSITCFTYGDKNICGQVLTADYDFLKTLDIQPLSGRDFSMEYAADTGNQVIATKSYADQFGEKNITGFSFYMDSAQPKIRIVGVIPDIQIQSLGSRQQPVVIFLNHGHYSNYALIKVNTPNPLATMDLIKKTYAGIEPGVEFQGSYVNENIDRLYREERLMANLLTTAAGIAILLSCMGLFGLASIIIRQRVKEIGVRKVLGASVSGLFILVSREFLKPVIIAFCIAAPVGWWLMNTWLNNYAYRVSIHWWVFAVAGLAALFITLCTVSFQSIRAALANPVKSLRSE